MPNDEDRPKNLPGLGLFGREDEPPAPASAERPKRPLLEAGLVFAAFWLSAWLPGDPRVLGSSLSLPSYHLSLLLLLLPKTLLLLYLMQLQEGLAAFGGMGRPALRDGRRALVTAALAFAAALLPAALTTLLTKGGNPLLEATTRPLDPAWLLVPAVLLSCAAVGYAEELFFRVFLLRRLGQAGLPTAWAGLASVLLFASAHGLQGGLGMAAAALIGGCLVLRRLSGSSLHELAWAHGLYDAAVILISLYR
jgi:membrane protease YdiL (CAAX protease family)